MAEPEGGDSRLQILVSQLSHAANLGIPPEELLTRAVDGVVQLTRAAAGVAWLMNARATGLELVSVRGIRPLAARALPRALELDVDAHPERLARPLTIDAEPVPGLGDLQARLGAEGLTGGVVVPLWSDGRLLGLVMAMFRGGGPAVALTEGALEGFQRQVATALANARLRQSLQSANTELLRLVTLAKILGEPRELEETLTTVARAAQSFSGAAAAAVWLADRVARRLTRIVLLAPEIPRRLVPMRFAYGEGVPGWVAEHERALFLDDALADPRVAAREWVESLGAQAIYAFPLRFDEALVGVLSVATAAPLPAAQLSLFETFCDHAALAIGHASLLRGNEIHAEQLRGLVAAARAVSEGRPRRAVLRTIGEGCRRATGALWLGIWKAEPGARRLSLLYADPPPEGAARRRLPYGAGLPGWSALHRKPRIAADLGAEPTATDGAWYAARGIRAGVSYPLLAARGLVGVFELGTPAPLAAEQLPLVEGYAALAASVLSRPARRGDR